MPDTSNRRGSDLNAQQSPATPRRRGLIAIAFLLIVIGGLGWLYWPRIDPRFLGTWTWYAADHGLPERLEDAELVANLIFNGDGSGRAVTVKESEDLAQLVWSVNGRGQLMLELSLTPAEQFQAISDRIRALLSGKSTGPNEDVWEIHESSEDRITLRNTALPDSFTILKRVAPSNSIR